MAFLLSRERLERIQRILNRVGGSLSLREFSLAVVVADGVNVSRELVRLGLAWRYEAYSKDTALLAAQNEAKAVKRGLWRDPAPVPPWEWRAKAKAK